MEMWVLVALLFKVTLAARVEEKHIQTALTTCKDLNFSMQVGMMRYASQCLYEIGIFNNPVITVENMFY